MDIYEVVSWGPKGPNWSVEFHSHDAAVIFARDTAKDERNQYMSIVLMCGFTKLMSWNRQDGKVVERLFA